MVPLCGTKLRIVVSEQEQQAHAGVLSIHQTFLSSCMVSSLMAPLGLWCVNQNEAGGKGTLSRVPD